MRPFFSKSERTDRLDPKLFVFVRFLRTPHPRRTYFLNDPFIKKKSKKHIDIKRKYKEEMEGVHNNASVFMHLNIEIIVYG